MNYNTVSTASNGQRIVPETLQEQMLWESVISNPSNGRQLDLNNDLRFLDAQGFQKMEVTSLSDKGYRVIIHYQYNYMTGKPYDIKITYPLY